MNGLPKVLLVACTLSWPLALFAAEAAAPRLQQEAQELLAQGEGEQAYARLQAGREYEGQGWYEVLLAEAELATGRTDAAVARLERHVRSNPMQDPPQFLLARGYERQGQPDKAAAQYRRLYEESPFEGSREKARAELARLGQPPVIAVGEPQKDAPPPAEPAQFGPEKGGLLVNAFAGAGYDGNANSGTDAERYFFYDLSPQQRDSDSFYYTGGATFVMGRALSDGLAWRTGIAASTTGNPSAHFADSDDLSLQMQLRWSGPQQRLSAGLAHSVRSIDDRRSDSVVAAGLKLETLTRVLLLTVSGEGAQIRFPHASAQDVDTFYMRTEAAPAPREDARWMPRVAAVFGFEHEKQEASPFGRKLWGMVFGAARILSERVSLDGELGYTKSTYDDAFTGTRHRSDDSVQARLFAHWTTRKDSPWQHAFGVRYRNNASNEALFDFDRFVVGYELSGTWGESDEPN